MHALAQSRPRTPGLVQLVLATVIAVLLAAVSLTVRQPPPPNVAEFAPQAAEQIKEPPKEQSSEFGSGEGAGDCPPGAKCEAGEGGGSSAGGSTTTSTASATPTDPPTTAPPGLKRCVGDPPRQIEDPQSPPCIAYWDDSKGNGGATSPGVTKDTITIAAPNPPLHNFYEVLARFFSTRFQLYGRTIKIENTNTTGVAGADLAKERGAFASLASYSDLPYYRQLVKHRIIGMYRTTDFSDSELAAAAPYLWGYTMSYSQMMTNLADWACRRLVGQKAAHAGRLGERSLSASNRSFGILLQKASVDSTLTTDVLESALKQCGAEVPFVTAYPVGNDAIRSRNDMAALKSRGVTTVFCLCRPDNRTTLQNIAEADLYQPEWLMTSYPQFVVGNPGSSPQMDRIFGVAFEPMDRVPDDHPMIWALREADPSNPNGRERTSTIGSNNIHYRAFLALASGLQMAGPNLTPETFRAGLQKTRFPNPDHPIMAGRVGFQGDFSMTNDGAEFWYSSTSPGPYEGQEQGPALCWIEGGRRRLPGTWPRGGDPFFTGPCESGRRPVS